MVSSITGFSAISYLEQVKGVNKTTPVTPQPTPAEEPKAEASSAKSATPLQSANPLQLPAAALAILQDNQPSAGTGNAKSLLTPLFAQDSSGSTDITAELFGKSTNPNSNSLSSLLTDSSSPSSGSKDIFSAALQVETTKAAPVQAAVEASTQAAASTKAETNPLQTLLSTYHTGLNAYNKVLQQNAQSALAQSKTPLVA